MDTQEIARDQWVRVLDDFSKQHAGWIVTLEVVGATIGDQEEATGLPLVGIGADVKDGESRIEVMLGGTPEAHVTRIIDGPKRVWLERADEPAHDAVAVESKDGTTTIVRFQHVPPEAVDRLLPG
jgi:hypothetical protein